MRTLRRILAALVVPVLLLVPTVVGALVAVLFTPSGHGLLARVATKWISGAVAGGVEIGAVSGNVWNHIVLERVVVHDEHGNVVVSTPHLEASYLLPELLSHRMIFRGVRADSLELHLVQLRSGQWNYEKIFHLNEGPSSGKPPDHVAFTDLEVTSGNVRIDVPTSPGRPRQPASRNGRAPLQPRIESTADGPVRVWLLSNLAARIPLLRISTPQREPILARIAALRTVVNDPNVTITQMAGEIVTAHDTLHFKFDSLGLPSSRLHGSGAIRWPNDTILSDFTLDAPRVALRDLWFIQPDFPDWEGRGHVVAKSLAGSRTDYHLDNLSLGRGSSSIAGKVNVMVDAVRGVGMGDLDMQLRNAPIDLLRPYLDTLPFSGTLTGHLTANGFLDALQLGGDMVFADALVTGAPTSQLHIDGLMHFGGAEGAIFEQFKLDHSALALGTVRRMVPSMVITGDLRLNGTLDGPWQNAQFVGTVEHAAPEGSLSRMTGSLRLDSRGTVLGVALDGEFDPLSFDALRTGYPDLAARGGLSGHVNANGNLDSLDINANMAGEIGSFTAVGRIKVNSPNYGADSLVLDIRRLDVEALLGSGSSTSLNGRIVARGTVDSGAAPRGSLSVMLDRSRIGGATVDAVTGTVHADRGMLTVDTGTVIWNSGQIDAHGTLGWAAPDSGTLSVVAVATSLAPFDSLMREFTGIGIDTLNPRTLDGVADAALSITGSVNAARISGTVSATQVVLDAWHAGRFKATLNTDSLGRRFNVEATLDTVGNGTNVADRLHVLVSGKPDSLLVAGDIAMFAMAGSGGGILESRDGSSRIRLDSLSLVFPRQAWRLAGPARVEIAANQVTFRDPFRLVSADGNGEVRVSGVVPGDAPGNLDAHVDGLALLDIFGVLQRDTTALDGWGSLDLHLAGTRDAPTFKGTASIASPVLGTAHLPTVQAAFDYSALRLRSTVSLWSTGQKVFDGTASLPLDLALATRTQRRLPGELQISGVGDSVDMVILSAIAPDVRDPTGFIGLDLKGSGTWQSPRLSGALAVHNGAVTLPSIGSQRYAPINAQARFVADSLVIDSLLIHTTDGQLSVKGGLRFEQLTKPTMNLNLAAQQFLAMDVPGNMTIRATGDMRLFGPLMHPVLMGDDVTLSRSAIYFTDILTKDVIDLEDPRYASLIDTAALHRRGVRSEFSTRFLDSLYINGLGLHIGSDVWLRSAEANIQLEGGLVVYKERKTYELTGMLSTPRGTYTLVLGPIEKDFRVDQGTVQYFGTADLNANLSIKAHHQVHTVDGDQFNVEATITNTMLDPKVTLSAPGRNYSQRDLLSYVLFGRSEFQVTGTQQQIDAGSSSITFALGALTSQLRRSVGNTIGASTFTITPGTPHGAVLPGSTLTQVAAGWQLGSRWFVTFDAGLCFGGAPTQQRNFGASLEYRFAREFRIQAAGEPVQTCVTNRAADAFTRLNRYQLGGDFLWQKDY